MIRVNRPAGSEPAVLKDPGSVGERERQRVQDYYADPANQNRGYDNYNAYRNDEVKDALLQIFHRKCAYCERGKLTRHSMEVEHYRPKNAVLIRGQKVQPGYWWLASDWENLLPSCKECNQKLTQELIGRPGRVLGKGILFPIKSEKKRARARGEEKRETRRLLNPCLDDPAEHLQYLDDGNVRGKTRKGKTSIRVLGLRRMDLVEDRAVHAQDIRKRLDDAIRFLEEIQKQEALGNHDTAETFRPHLLNAIAAIEEYRNPNKDFLALVTMILDPILAQIRASTVQTALAAASAQP